MLKWRLLLGALIVGSLLGLCILDARADVPGTEAGLPGVFLMPILLVVTVLATQEVLRLARAAGIRPVAWTIYAGNLLLVVAQWLPVAVFIHGRAGPLGQLDIRRLPVDSRRNQFATLGIGRGHALDLRGGDARYAQPGGTLAKIAVGVFSLIYIGLMFTFAVQMRLFWGVGAVAAWIISVKMGDIGAYTVGRLFGRNKMSPAISPGKTMEGAMGAMLFALIGSWISFRASPANIPVFDWIHFHRVALPAISGWIPFRGVVPWRRLISSDAGQAFRLVHLRIVDGRRRHAGRPGRVVVEARRRLQGLQRLDARLRRRAGHSRFAPAFGARGLAVLVAGSWGRGESFVPRKITRGAAAVKLGLAEGPGPLPRMLQGVIIYAMATIPEAFAIAVQHHQAGRLQAAEQIYRQIDAFGRMVSRSPGTGSGVSGETTQNYLYDGQDMVLVLNGAGQVTSATCTARRSIRCWPRKRWRAPAPQAAGTTNWYLTDNQGTVRDVVHAGIGGTTNVDHLIYDAFGHVASQKTGASQPAFTYDGLWQDPETGLLKTRTRWYDAVDNVFASRDPLGFGGGQTNLSEYCGNSATNGTDPSGEDCLWNQYCWGNRPTFTKAGPII